MIRQFSRRFWIGSCLGALAGLALIAGGTQAADRTGKAANAGQAVETVDMFQAMQDGNIAVRLIPRDSKESRLIIENKTQKPLTVKLPDAFAGVPVLAQVAPGGAGGRNPGMGGGNQGIGGGGGGMMGGGGMGGGMFYVAPEKAAQARLTTVCLEHGKTEPKPNVPYEIKPIETFTDKPAVWELCRMLGSGQINQRAAQACAWHLNNNMSWEQLAAKRLRFANGASQPYFSPQEIRAGMQLAMVAVATAEKRKQQQPSANASEGQ